MHVPDNVRSLDNSSTNTATGPRWACGRKRELKNVSCVLTNVTPIYVIGPPYALEVFS